MMINRFYCTPFDYTIHFTAREYSTMFVLVRTGDMKNFRTNEAVAVSVFQGEIIDDVIDPVSKYLIVEIEVSDGRRYVFDDCIDLEVV